MGLYTILKKHRLKDRQLRILFLGLDAAGKSTIVARLLSPTHSAVLKDISPTLGFKISTTDLDGYKLNICTLLLSMGVELTQGMWADRGHYAHTGAITLSRRMAWFGSLTLLTANG
jgi:GTPase SAR1 family protein